MERRICIAFISHLEDSSRDVQGNAIKCIQKIAAKIRDKNLIMIVEKLADMVVTGEKEVRDINSIAIKSIISGTEDDCATALIKAIYPRMIKGNLII